MSSPLPLLQAPHESPTGATPAVPGSLLSLADVKGLPSPSQPADQTATANRRHQGNSFVLDRKILELAKKRDLYSLQTGSRESSLRLSEPKDYLHSLIYSTAACALMDQTPQIQKAFRTKLHDGNLRTIAALMRCYVDHQLKPVLDDLVKVLEASERAAQAPSSTPSAKSGRGTKRRASRDVDEVLC
eukprot:TRINITY_DN5882_c0_g1_i1.p1 TRINITY_DN5882_c0_g1~~TRINITY_DN5882_c0_g1_i1.p1  ORF type:complete len:187 (-),score=16.76 TRINITY_DN5882_c0_g1_i1:250-810(-)